MKLIAAISANFLLRSAAGFGLLVLIAPVLQAQTRDLPFPQDTDIFRRILLDSFYVKPLKTWNELASEPEKKLLIVLGQTLVLKQVPGGLEEFVRAGGAALVATDRATKNADGGALDPFGVWIDGGKLSIFMTNPRSYKRRRDSILVDFIDGGKRPIIFKKPKSEPPGVATNKPSYLHLDSPLLNVQATFPPTCRLEPNNTPARQPLPFVAAGEVGRGRILVLSDHSVFINAMLWQDDNLNLDFLDSCLEWLIDEKRTEVLFVDENQIKSEFDVPLKDVPVPLPPVEDVLTAVNKGLAGLEEENRFNEAIGNALDRISEQAKNNFTGRVLTILTIGLGLAGLSRLSQLRQRREPGLPALTAILAQQRAGAPALEQRFAAMRNEGNYREPAQAVARQFFESAFALKPEGVMPRSVFGALAIPWYYWRTRIQVRRLWHLAAGGGPARVSHRDLVRILRKIDRLNAEFAK
jgi:hypothetical protein